VIAALGLVTLLAVAPADARRYRPPDARTFHGVSDTGEVADFQEFRRQVDAHPAVMQAFLHWDVPVAPALERFDAVDARGAVSLSTKEPAGGDPEISPRRIARGYADRYILRYNEAIGRSGQVVYLRLFGEMNGHWNPYCAFNADGSRRDPAHSTRWFRLAWQRFAIIARGGKRAKVNLRLHKRGMPLIYRAPSNDDPVYRRQGVPRQLQRPRVAFVWTPQTVGSPNVRGNRPRSYWPGGQWVDWVGADIYSKFESFGFSHLEPFYRRWRGRPFVIGEYSPWDNDYDGSFVDRLFAWAREHRRTRMLLYYQGFAPDDPHEVQHYSGARSALRRILDRRRYDPWAPGTRD
jgi:hypothetical protein